MTQGGLVGDSQEDLIDSTSQQADFETLDIYDELTRPSAKNLTFEHFVTESEIVEQIWCGETDSVLLILTEEKNIYRSEDQGRSYKLKDEYKLVGKGKEAGKKIGKIFQIEVSPIDPNLVFFLGDRGMNWLSEDCGASFKPLNNGRKIHDFVFHPTERGTALASIYTECEDFEEEEDCEIYKELYYTKDLGSHWDFLTDHAVQFDWGLGSADDEYMHADSIIIVKQKDPISQRQRPWSSKNQILMSEDFFKTEKVLLTGGNQFALTTDYMYAG